MIHYHGGPITPVDVAEKVYRAGHAFISFYDQRDIELAAELCQSFAVDNGAFSAWKQGAVIDWLEYYKWVDHWHNHPGFDFAVIPDVIDGTEEENDDLLKEWPEHLYKKAPVWHVHESIDRLERLAYNYGRVCIGSSGEFSQVGTPQWWDRMWQAMEAICVNGHPITRLHGLRMLNHRVFSRLPMASADSTNVARNHKSHNYKKSGYFIMKTEIEHHNSCGSWPPKEEGNLFENL